MARKLNRQFIALFLCTTFVAILTSCTPDVLVVDDEGTPIEGAIVVPMASSFNGPNRMTDSNGFASLPCSLFTWQAIGVHKRGFDEIGYMGAMGSRPVRATLHREPDSTSMVLEYLDSQGKVVRRIMDFGCKGIETTVRSLYHLSPSQERKDVGPLQGVLLVSQPGDLDFQRPQVKMYLLPRDLPELSGLSPPSPFLWDWLIGRFKYQGTPYGGGAKSDIPLP